MNVVTGTALDLLTSASGRIFAAWLPHEITAQRIDQELAAAQVAGLRTRADVADMLAQVRADGVASVSGYHLVPGVEAVAAPVFNFKNEITLAMLVVGVQGMFDMSLAGPVVAALKHAAADLSERLGHTRAQAG